MAPVLPIDEFDPYHGKEAIAAREVRRCVEGQSIRTGGDITLRQIGRSAVMVGRSPTDHFPTLTGLPLERNRNGGSRLAG